MKTFLCPTDFSSTAKHAVKYGYQIARQIKANVVLCNAVRLPSEALQVGLSVWPAEESDVLLKESAGKLVRLKLRLEKTSPNVGFRPQITCINEGGTIKHVIDGIVENEHVDMVIIGTHNGGVLNTFLLGNQSRVLIDVITKPLLLVPPEAQIAPVKKIAFATDFEDIKGDLESIYTLISLARPLNAEILITHIYHKVSQTPEFKQVTQKIMNELSDKADYPHIYYRAFTNSSADAGLDWLCQHGAIDILAMVHRSHTFIDSIFRGSQTKKIAGHLPIPLLVFPAVVKS